MKYLVAAYVVCFVLLAVYLAVLSGRVQRLADRQEDSE